jgi:transcriptional regulator with XRE-family HTH domain
MRLIYSPPYKTMSAVLLRDEVVAARMARAMTATALQRASGLSARTLRDIEAGTPQRRYSLATLSALDRAFGWPAGHAWRLWQEGEGAVTPLEEIAEQMALLREEVRRRLDAGEVRDRERPAWADELVGLVRLLSAEDRRRVFDYVQRLAPG